MNEQKTTAPTLSSSCIQIDFSAGTWTGSKLDKKASEEIATINKANPTMTNVYKKLLGDCQELIAIRKSVGNVRNSHYRMTLPWSDMGLRIIPTAKYFDYHKQMTEYQNEFYTMLDKFIGVYDWAVIQAETTLGDMFNKNDYPSVDTLRAKFSWRLSYIEMPKPEVSEDFRIKIGQEQADAIEEQCAEYYSTMFQKALKDVAEPLKNMSERLDYEDTGEVEEFTTEPSDAHPEGRTLTRRLVRIVSTGEVVPFSKFADTLVSHATNASDLLGVTSDPKYVKIKQELDHAFTGITPDALREDPTLRKTTKQAVDNAIASLDF